MTRVLVVDDDAAIREMAALALEKNGLAVERASNLASARRVLESVGIDVVVCDIYLGAENGIDLLREVRASRPEVHVILMTARGTVETAALADEIGAADYLAKPFDPGALVALVREAVSPPPDEVEIETGPESRIVGSHPSMVEVYKSVARVAKSDVPVLVTGETGTGKELVARAIHEMSARKSATFVAVNCGAIPDTLLESELFGHVRGAFTDARRDRRGAFMRASGGTIFLDEIGDVSPSFQVKLLRVLQDGVVTPLGADHGEDVDARVVAATNRNLHEAIEGGRFREDLYYRLAAYEIRMPALRERRDDIALLVEHFRKKAGTRPPSREVLALLEAHDWPGNVRELERFVQRMAIDSGGLADAGLTRRILGTATQRGTNLAKEEVERPDSRSLEDAERTHVLAVLEACGGNRTRAATILGIDRKTLRRKLQKWGVDAGDDDDET
jgi:two-component system, NtrC family, nitrogen regulation response regulator GlnG